VATGSIGYSAITTFDLEKYKLRNEEKVRYSIRDYIKTSHLVIEHVPQTMFELDGPHQFLQYDESCEGWTVDLRVWNVLTPLEPIFQGAGSFNGNEKLEVFVMSKSTQETAKHEELLVDVLTPFGKREFIHFNHIHTTLQEFNRSIISVQE